jgi:hypothetical protein
MKAVKLELQANPLVVALIASAGLHSEAIG